MYLSEVEEFGEMSIRDYFFNFGINLRDRSKNHESLILPESVGRFVMKSVTLDPFSGVEDPSKVITIPMIPCRGLDDEFNTPLSPRMLDNIQHGSCFDRTNATLEGVFLHGSNKIIKLDFEPCASRTDGGPAGVGCLSTEDALYWVANKKPVVEMIYSTNFVDFSVYRNVLKKGATFFNIGEMSGLNRVRVSMPLRLSEVDIEDALLNPFAEEDNENYFMTPSELTTFSMTNEELTTE